MALPVAKITQTLSHESASRPFVPDLRGHLPVLDAARGAAILMVMLYHFEMSAVHATRFPYRFAQFGWCGVDLFFVLSGFLITGILLDARHDAHYFRNFFARRMLRIFPLYYAVLGILAVVMGLMAVNSAGIAQLSQLQGWLWCYGANFKLAIDGAWSTFRGGPFDLGHLWSLAVEEHFYLVWPAIVLGLNRGALMRFCVAIGVVAIALRLYCVAQGNIVAAYVLTPCRMDALAVGAWIALAARGPNGMLWLRKWARWTAAIAACLILAICFSAGGAECYHPGFATIGYTLLDLFFGAILVMAICVDPASIAGSWLAARWLRSMGKYSYSLYVLHMFLMYPVAHSFFYGKIHSTFISIWLTVLVACITTYAFAWLSWYLFERHFLKLKRFFPHSTRPQPSGSLPLANPHPIPSLDRHATQVAAGDSFGR